MEALFGYNAHDRQARTPVEWDSKRLTNPHMVMMGDTGSGKTVMLRKVCGALARTGSNSTRLHIFDRAGDISLPGASSVIFSQSTDYGINPLELNPDPHYGGVRRCVQAFISCMNRSTQMQKLGHRQQAVLRNLLHDLFRANGFGLDDPSSWIASGGDDTYCVPGKEDRLFLEVPFEEKDAARRCGLRWDAEERAWWCAIDEYEGKVCRWPVKVSGVRYPTLLDAIRFTNSRLRAMFLGSSQEAVRALEAVQRAAKALTQKQRAAARAGGAVQDGEELSADLQGARAKAIAAYTAAVQAVRTGHELEDLLKYDSIETVKSVVDRLENVYAMGVCRSVSPPFDPAARIHHYSINALHDDAQKLLVDTKAESIFARALQRGPQQEVRDIIVLDEAKAFVTDEDDHILNRIAREGRKYGVMLLLASQGPAHFTDDLISAAGTKIVLGFDRNEWPKATRMLGMSHDALQWIVPWRRCVVMMKRAGELQSAPYYVEFGDSAPP